MPDRQPSPLDRFLRLFTDVRGGEGGTALLLTLNVFLLLTAYYILKPVREALILVGGGAEIKAYAAAGQGPLLLAAVPMYARLASLLPRRRLINTVTLFFTGCLALFYVLAQFDVPLGVVFYLWVGIFNLMIIAQFWSFANDIYSQDEGKRLFPIVAFGASSGAVAGGALAWRLADTLGNYQLMLLAGVLLLASLALTGLVDTSRRRAPATDDAVTPQQTDEPLGDEKAFRLVLRSRYLLLIALLIMLLNWVNTTGEYILGKVVKQAAVTAVSLSASGLTEGQYITEFYGGFFTVVNILGVVVQLFLVSRVIKYAGIRWALLVLPAIALVGYALLAFVPILAVVRWAKTAENATDYSLQNTVRQALFLPTTREEKYKAKQAIDTFFVRAGDVLSAALVFAGVNWLAFETQHFALVNLVLVGLWIALALAIGRGYDRLAASRGHNDASPSS